MSWRVGADHADMTRARRPAHPVTMAAMPKPITADLARSAMIVIDMQNDFCHPDGWLAGIGVDVAPTRAPINPLNRLLPVLRGAGVPIIWVNWGARPDRANLSPALLHVYDGAGVGKGLGDPLPNGSPVLTEGSWAAAVVDELDQAPSDLRVSKHRMSGFWDTPLDQILRNLDVTTLFFGGVNADQCVLHTLADANFLGYDTIMIEDCSATSSPAYCWDATLYNVRTIFGFTVTSSALITGLDPSK
ncbi:MAG: isochorismatase family cysteine hydrolase [Alphaproteobacteria bacterium]